MPQMSTGMYQTACEKSPNRQQIDQWLNEGKSSVYISKKLMEIYGENISSKGILKYKKYRDEFIQKELEKSPEYQAKIKEVNEQMVNGIGKIRHIDTIGKLADVIDQTSEMLLEARGQLHINSVKDMSMVGDTLLNAIKLYGDTVLKAQRFDQVNKDPSLLKPQTINVNVKNVLSDLLKEAIQQGDGYSMIDKIRGASQQPILDADYTESEGEDEEIAESAELGGEEDE